MAQDSGPGLTRLLSSALVALKLKQSGDEYSKLSTDDEGRLALEPTLPPNYRDVEGDAPESARLLDTEISVARPTRRKSPCCVCFGMDCSLFWKVLGVLLLLGTLWNAFKLIRWATTPTPTGLEHMPVFSDSLKCQDAEYIYNAEPTAFNIPIGSANADHGIDVRGGAVGTIMLLEGAPNATKVRYEFTIRASDRKLLESIIIQRPDDDSETVSDSHLLIATGHPEEGSCLRFDIRIFVPPTLKKLHVAAHAVAQVQFDPESFFQFDEFYTTLFTTHHHNMIIPHNNLRADILALEVFEGWIVGDVSLSDTTKVTTQRGSGVMNVRVHPTPPEDPANPQAVSLRTTSGRGRTDVFYVDTEAHVHRPMNNIHLSSLNGDMYFTYRDAHYRGRIELASQSYTATGLQRVDGGGTDDNKFTHWYGDELGKDEISIRSRGWVGLYF